MFPSLSGKTSIRTKLDFSAGSCTSPCGFHPFQGRPLFGQTIFQETKSYSKHPFPSLSGKTSIRTKTEVSKKTTVKQLVSIPFREDLYSDARLFIASSLQESAGFHPFQGRPLFGHKCASLFFGLSMWVVSIPFREDLYSDPPYSGCKSRVIGWRSFPSLSGKTSIRT